MSIIQEALRKAQGEYVEKKMPSAAKEKAFRSKMEIRIPQGIETARPMFLPVLVGILTILLALYGLAAAWQYSKKHVKENIITKPAPLTPIAKTIDIPKAVDVAPAVKQPPVFALNGIMYIENKPQAIINGYILEEGDEINGAKILTIEKDCVLLYLNDSNIKLDLKK